MSKEENKINEIIKLWKELGVDRIEFDFCCGGDDMYDTTLSIFGEDDEKITNSKISNFFEDEIYRNVDFYVDSDGYYQGEAGTVYVRISDEEDGFYYDKSAKSEYHEDLDGEAELKLNKKEIQFIKEKILNINGSIEDFVFNFNKDCIISEKDQKIMESIENKMIDKLSKYEPKECEGETDEWFSFTTNQEGEEIKIDNNKLVVCVTKKETVYRDSE